MLGVQMPTAFMCTVENVIKSRPKTFDHYYVIVGELLQISAMRHEIQALIRCRVIFYVCSAVVNLQQFCEATILVSVPLQYDTCIPEINKFEGSSDTIKTVSLDPSANKRMDLLLLMTCTIRTTIKRCEEDEEKEKQ